MKKNILVPFDGSENATEALHLAINMAKLMQEKVVVLNIQPSFHSIHTKMFFSQTTIREYQEQLFRETVAPAEAILRDAGVEYELKLRVGDAKDQVFLEATGDNPEQDGCAITGIRMIVMGSRGMNPVVGGVLGSVSYGVVNAAPCPITIVPYSCDK